VATPAPELARPFRLRSYLCRVGRVNPISFLGYDVTRTELAPVRDAESQYSLPWKLSYNHSLLTKTEMMISQIPLHQTLNMPTLGWDCENDRYWTRDRTTSTSTGR
jgi:hypothetical protein